MYRTIAFLFFCCVWLPSSTFGNPLVISEFLADNQTGLKDEDGAFSDWIELQNVTSNAVNTAGWSLTDSVGNLRKWVLPATNIAPQGFSRRLRFLQKPRAARSAAPHQFQVGRRCPG